MAEPGKANRTDLLDSSRLPGEAPAGSQGQVARRAEVAQGMPRAPRTPVLGQKTSRPNEPVTAGLPIGAGPGVNALPARQDTLLDRYRSLLQASGDPVLAVLIGRIEEAGRR